MNIKSFSQSAKSLSRNPLGIISLFIVLVYAVAGLVIIFAQPSFYQYPCHPAVIFLFTFPILVLIVFTYLVVCHHQKLYAPNDFENQEHFFRLPFAPLLSPPLNVPENKADVVTSDKSNYSTEESIKIAIGDSYKKLVSFGYCLIHETEVLRARTSPRSGQYVVRVWIEAIERIRPLSEIESVTYRVWDDFSDPVHSTGDASSNFDLWISTYGEFLVVALVKAKDGNTIELQRYLDLPGRPPD